MTELRTKCPKYNFGAYVAILLARCNLWSSLYKMPWSSPRCWTTAVKNLCKDLNIKLEVKYLFPTSSSGEKSDIYQLPDSLGMRKILKHDIRMQKNPQTRANITFSGFSWILMELWGPKFQLSNCKPLLTKKPAISNMLCNWLY